jgi:hypothetical protein
MKNSIPKPSATPAPSNPANETSDAKRLSLGDDWFDFYREAWRGVLMPDGFRSYLAGIEESLDVAIRLHELTELDSEHNEEVLGSDDAVYHGLQDRHRSALINAQRLLLRNASADLAELRERGKPEHDSELTAGA